MVLDEAEQYAILFLLMLLYFIFNIYYSFMHLQKYYIVSTEYIVLKLEKVKDQHVLMNRHIHVYKSILTV